MHFLAPSRYDPDVADTRKTALRDSIMFIGFMKILGVLCFIILLTVVMLTGKDHTFGLVLQFLIGVAIVPQVVAGAGLLSITFRDSRNIHYMNLMLTITIASAIFNILFGIAAVYFYLTVKKIMALVLVFVLWIVINLFAICHDVTAICLYRSVMHQ